MPRFQGIPLDQTVPESPQGVPSTPSRGGRFGGIPLDPGFGVEPQADFSGVTARVIEPPRVPTRTQQLVESGRIPASWQIPVESAEQGLRAARKGLTLGFSDELQGALAVPGAVLSGEDAGEAYRQARDRERGLNRQFAQDYPAASALGQLGGGFLTASGPARAIAQTPSRIMQLLRTSGTGAGIGGLAGLGGSEAETVGGTLSDVGTGAAIGGVAAPVIAYGVAPVVQRGISGLSRLGGLLRREAPSVTPTAPRPGVSGQPTPQVAPAPQVSPPTAQPAAIAPRQRAIGAVAQTLRRSGRTPQEIEAQLLADEQLAGKPEILADFLGDRGAQQLYSTRVLGGQRSAEALERLGGRVEGTGARVSEDIQRATTQRGGSLNQIDQVIDNRRRMGNTLYQRAFEHGEVQNPEVLTLLQNPRVAQVMAQASERRAASAAFRGESYNPLFSRNAAGEVTMTRAPTVEDLHLLKTSLDDDIRQAYQAGEGQLGNAMRSFKERITGALEDEVPAYRQAREAYRGDYEIEEAITAGRNDILKKPVDELRRDFAKLSKSEQDGFRAGAVDQILQQRLDRSGDTYDIARKLWGNPDIRNRLSLLFNDASPASLARQMAREQQIARTNRAVFGGSPTNIRDAATADTAAQAAEIGADVVTGGVRSAAMNVIQKAIRRTGGITEAVADDIADILTTEGPENIRAILRTLREADQAKVVNALNRQRAGTGGAATLSLDISGGTPGAPVSPQELNALRGQ